MRFGIRLYSEGSSDLIGENWQREILSPDKVWKMREYCMYFPFFIPQAGGKRSAAQPKTIYSEVP